MQVRLSKKIKYLILPLLLAILASPQAFADSHQHSKQSFKQISARESYQPRYTLTTPHFTLYLGDDQLPSSTDLEVIGKTAVNTLNSAYEELSRIFGAKPKDRVVLRFLSPTEFRRQTGAPEWTSAMYYRGEISVPLNEQMREHLPELKRALRHEYVHAVVAELSGFRAPAWLDEGIAQLIEGHPNPLLGPALRAWVSSNEAIPLDWLDNGFTTLKSELVPTAYAQSLFAARTLVQQKGFRSVREYLALLKAGSTENGAFNAAFGTNKKRFERSLTSSMRRWSTSRSPHP